MYVDPAHQRVVAGTATDLSWQQIGGDGEPVDPGTVTVTVTRADGTAIATNAATNGSGSAARTYALTAAQTALLDRLTVAWVAAGVTLATTEVDVVAAPWFSNAELRAADKSLSSEAQFPASLITLARLQVEAFIEKVTHRRFVPGYHRQTIPGSQSCRLVLPHVDVRRVRSASLYDYLTSSPIETLDAPTLAAIPPSPSGVIERPDGRTWCARHVVVGYEWGLATPPPTMKAAAMKLCHEILVTDTSGTIPDNAVTWSSTELGWSAVLVTPGVRGAHTRLPTVNKVLDDWTFEEFGIA